MKTRDLLELWSTCHVLYDKDTYLGRTKDAQISAIDRAEFDWRQHLVANSPHGHLLTANAFFDMLRHSPKLYLLHITTHLEQILEQGVLYSSSGCLVGSVYSTPLCFSEEGLRLHSLGSYILERQIPRMLLDKGLDLQMAQPIIIELDYPEQAYRGLVGLDHLRLGTVHMEIFEELKYLLSVQERSLVQERVVTCIKNAAQFLRLCNQILYSDYKISGGQFVDALTQAIREIPVLGYLYFEVISEYMVLYSQDSFSTACAIRGEFNCWGYKELHAILQPGSFNLGEFRPTISELEWALDRVRAEGLTDIRLQDLTNYLVKRLSFLVNARFFGKLSSPINWSAMRDYRFEEIAEAFGPLLGHSMNRELRSLDRYADFYFYFNQYKALQAWNYWNSIGVIAPFNGVIPKGEIGPNPAYPDLRHKLYTGLVYGNNRAPFITLERELDITIAPRLIDLGHSFLRSAAKADENASQMAIKSSTNIRAKKRRTAGVQ